MLPHLVLPDCRVRALGALVLGHQVLLENPLDVAFHDVGIREGVVAVPTDVPLRDAVVQNDAHVDLAVAMTNNRNTFSSFFCREFGPAARSKNLFYHQCPIF